MKRTLVICVCLLVVVSMLCTSAVVFAGKPEKPGGGKPPKDEPPADPVIAVVTPTGRGYNDLVVMNADGSNKVEVLEGYSLDTPSWSPDGSSIAFSEYYDELWTIDVVLDEDGKPIGVNKFFILDRMQGNPEWSPGGPYADHILITRYPDEGGYAHTLEVVPTGGGNPIELYTDPAVTLWNAVWSPGGDRIAVAESSGGVYGLAILDYDGNGGFVKTVSYELPHWPNCMDWARLRTNNEIAYSIRYKIRNKYIHELWTVDSDTGNPTFLFKGDRPTWSPEDNLCFEYNGLRVYDFGRGESEQISKYGYYPDWSRSIGS
jgi:dipeptidyl aminopeptidase/acylaminoacyl peptidase